MIDTNTLRASFDQLSSKTCNLEANIMKSQ